MKTWSAPSYMNDVYLSFSNNLSAS